MNNTDNDQFLMKLEGACVVFIFSRSISWLLTFGKLFIRSIGVGAPFGILRSSTYQMSSQ